MASVVSFQSERKTGPRLLDWVGQPLLLVYWTVCIGVIALGADRRFPEIRQSALDAVYGPRVDHPFANCGAAHAAGVYNIRADSPGYVPAQDRDRDGLACEPAPLRDGDRLPRWWRSLIG